MKTDPYFFNKQPADACGLYVHIPFCLKKCHYCDFVITTKRDPLTRKTFFDALSSEINNVLQKYGRLRFNTIYFGGGTPSALNPQEFEELCDLLKRNFDFEKNIEFTVEVNPGDVDEAKIKAYCQAGVNRVSLGVQALQEKLLKDMNRPHGVTEIYETIALLRNFGIRNVSTDIILNLPDQTLHDVEHTLERLLEMNPDQVSVYDLDVHENTAYGRRRREGQLNLSSSDDHAAMAKLVQGKLESAGMIHYELTNFAKIGFESKHNLIYWHNQPYLGLGPGAFSYLRGVRYQMAGSVAKYFQKSESNLWQPETEDHLTPEEIEKETFLTGIRLKAGIDLRRLDLLRVRMENAAANYLEEGLLEKDGFRLKFTDKGKPMAEWMLQRFACV